MSVSVSVGVGVSVSVSVGMSGVRSGRVGHVVGLGSVLSRHAHHAREPSLRREVKRRGVSVEQQRMVGRARRVKQRVHRSRLVAVRGRVQRRATCRLARVRVRARRAQRAHHVHVAHLGGKVQRRAHREGMGRVDKGRLARNQRARRGHVAHRGGDMQRGRAVLPLGLWIGARIEQHSDYLGVANGGRWKARA